MSRLSPAFALALPEAATFSGSSATRRGAVDALRHLGCAPGQD